MTTPDLEQSHGEFCDALMALRGFDGLLRSLRVSPRSIGDSLPDIHISCDKLTRAAQHFLTRIETTFGAGASGTLLASITELTTQLQHELATSHSINAARRLEIEQVSRRVVRELHGARVLMDLLREVALGQTTSFDVKNLFTHERVADPALLAGERVLRVTLVGDLSSEGAATLEMVCKPRVAILLVALSVAFVCDSHEPCAIRVAGPKDPSPGIVITRGAEQGRVIEIPVPRLLAASKACATTAAQVCHAQLEWQSDPRKAVLSWPSVS